MASELWQRLRAARRFSDLRQADIAKACGVSRGAVAQWESDKDFSTKPDVPKLKTISEMTRIPLDWLASDDSNLDDIWTGKFAISPRQAARSDAIPDLGFAHYSVAETSEERSIDVAELIRMEVESVRGITMPARIKAGSMDVTPDLVLNGDTLVEIKGVTNSRSLRDGISRLLMAERAWGRKCKLHMLVIDRSGRDDMAIVETCGAFGIQGRTVKSAVEAINFLTAL